MCLKEEKLGVCTCLCSLTYLHSFLINYFHTLNILRKIYHLIFFFKTVHVYRHIHLYRHEPEDIDVLRYYSQPYSPDTGSHWTGARVLASKPPGSTCLCPNSGGAGLPVCSWLKLDFCVGPGDLNLGPQACTASTVRSCFFSPKKLNCKIMLPE